MDAMPRSARYDAVVVGARVAGAATAMLLARRGLRVLAVEQARWGSDTLSTLALMRAGVLQLDRWGVLPAIVAAGTPPIRTTTFHYGDEAIPLKIKPRDGVDALYAPRRTLLDAELAEAARAAGAEVLHGVRVLDLVRTAGGRVEGVVLQSGPQRIARVEADLVIGADGVHSGVAHRVGAEPYVKGRHSGGVVYGLWSDLDLEGNHWYYRRGTGTGSIPTNDGLTIVFAAVPAQRFDEEIRFDTAGGYHRVLAECSPELAEAVSRARRIGSYRGFRGRVGYMRQSHGPGWALVGDAGYFKDPITAHGISDALRDAELLARAFSRGGERALADYQEARDALSVELFRITDRIASYDWDMPTVQELHLALSREMNREVAALVEMHGGEAAELPRSA